MPSRHSIHSVSIFRQLVMPSRHFRYLMPSRHFRSTLTAAMPSRHSIAVVYTLLLVHTECLEGIEMNKMPRGH